MVGRVGLNHRRRPLSGRVLPAFRAIGVVDARIKEEFFRSRQNVAVREHRRALRDKNSTNIPLREHQILRLDPEDSETLRRLLVKKSRAALHQAQIHARPRPRLSLEE